MTSLLGSRVQSALGEQIREGRFRLEPVGFRCNSVRTCRDSHDIISHRSREAEPIRFRSRFWREIREGLSPGSPLASNLGTPTSVTFLESAERVHASPIDTRPTVPRITISRSKTR